jgi:hypothetical protein
MESFSHYCAEAAWAQVRWLAPRALRAGSPPPNLPANGLSSGDVTLPQLATGQIRQGAARPPPRLTAALSDLAEADTPAPLTTIV